MRVKRLLVATGAAVALSAASAVPAQAHVLTCANTRPFVARQLGLKAPPGTTSLRLVKCHLGPVLLLASRHHRHLVWYDVALIGKLLTGQLIHCNARVAVHSTRLGIRVLVPSTVNYICH